MKADAVNEDTGAKGELSPVRLHPGHDFIDERDLLKARLEERQIELERLKFRISELEHENAEREALRRQAQQALSLTRRQLTKVLDEAAAIVEKRKENESEMERLRADLERTDHALIQTKHKFALVEHTLQKKREEIAQASKDLKSAREEASAIEKQLNWSVAAGKDLEAKLEVAEAWTFKLAGDRRAAEEGLAKAKRALSKERRARQLATQEMGALEATIDRLRKEISTTEDWRKSAECRRDEGFNEIVTMTRLLRASESTSARQRAELDWFMQVIGVIHANTTSWARFIPAFWQRRLCLRKLAVMRLFDAKEYLRRYPDVRASGQDPLRHYVLHGMAEGRQI